MSDCADNYVDGRGFVMLTKDEVRKLVPPIGIAKKILSLVPKVILSVI